jgi:hypothetical protein
MNCGSGMTAAPGEKVHNTSKCCARVRRAALEAKKASR